MTTPAGFSIRCGCCADPRRAGVSRRRLLATGLAAAGASLVSPATRAQPSKVIDVHHHASPPAFLAEWQARGLGQARGSGQWSPATSLEDMDKGGVSLAVLSVPNAWYNPSLEIAPRLSRDANDFMARVRQDHPRRFGVFAHLPLPYIDACLREIEYAFDTLKVDGVGLMTDYHDKWLGDPLFAPVFDELNRRKAVVYTHPKAMDCCRDIQPYLGDAAIEYGTDTTRTIASIVFQGLARRCPDLKFIFSHAGGTMPFLIQRFIQAAEMRTLAPQVPDGVLPVLQKFYYDVAQATHPIPLGTLSRLVPATQILFGTDYPFRTAANHMRGLRSFGFGEAELRAIEHGNALRIMPWLRV